MLFPFLMCLTRGTVLALCVFDFWNYAYYIGKGLPASVPSLSSAHAGGPMRFLAASSVARMPRCLCLSGAICGMDSLACSLLHGISLQLWRATQDAAYLRRLERILLLLLDTLEKLEVYRRLNLLALWKALKKRDKQLQLPKGTAVRDFEKITTFFNQQIRIPPKTRVRQSPLAVIALSLDIL